MEEQVNPQRRTLTPPPEQDFDIPNEYKEDIDDFENIEHENHAWLRGLMNVVDYL